MTHRRIAITLIGLIIIPSLAACNFQLAAPGANAGLAATQTLAALATQVQATLVGLPTPVGPTPVGGPTEIPSPTPVPPSEATATPVPTLSPTAVRLIARVNENTNCRTGPGTVYDHDYTALKDTELDIVGRSSVPDYVIVAIQGEQGHTCWLWTRYVTLIGDLSGLPVSTPPPTPTPSLGFALSYSFVANGCPFGFAPSFKVVNNGSVTFKSGKITAEDTVDNLTVENSTDVFDKRHLCAIETSIPDLDPGDSGYIYADSFPDPFGHEVEVTVTLCTDPGQTGQCVSRSITVTP